MRNEQGDGLAVSCLLTDMFVLVINMFRELWDTFTLLLKKQLNCSQNSCTVPKVIDVPRYNIKCSGENVILRGIFHVVPRFPLRFMLYRKKFSYSGSVVQ